MSMCAQEVARFCQWFGNDATADFATNEGSLCDQCRVFVFVLKLYALSVVL